MAISLASLRTTTALICHATGKLQVGDSEELHLVPMTIQVKIRPPKNGYGESNAIAYLPPVPATPSPMTRIRLRRSRPAWPSSAGRCRASWPKMAS